VIHFSRGTRAARVTELALARFYRLSSGRAGACTSILCGSPP